MLLISSFGTVCDAVEELKDKVDEITSDNNSDGDITGADSEPETETTASASESSSDLWLKVNAGAWEETTDTTADPIAANPAFSSEKGGGFYRTELR